jgi:hypothetical protein
MDNVQGTAVEIFKVEEFNKTEELEVVQDVSALCKKTEIKILNQEVYDAATEITVQIKKRYKELDERRKSITKPMDAQKKAVMDVYNPALKLLEDSEKTLKKAMLDYIEEQDHKAKLEQKRLQDLEDKRVADEKKKLEARIERAKESGKTEKVEELEAKKEEVVSASVPIIAPQYKVPEGQSFKDNWKAIVINANLVPREWCIPNEKALNDFAKSTKGTIQIAGIEFKNEKILNQRS